MGSGGSMLIFYVECGRVSFSMTNRLTVMAGEAGEAIKDGSLSLSLAVGGGCRSNLFK